MHKNFARQSQERSGLLKNIVKKLYKNFCVSIKAWIYLWNKSVLFLVLKEFYFYHCRSPPYSNQFEILN